MAPIQLLILVVYFHSQLQYSGAVERCQLESFDAKCQPNHVILVTSAKYGRMKLGRCLTRDYYVGCSDDVTNVLHERCSGKTECSVLVPNSALIESSKQCYEDLVSYLDAEYSCIQVTHFPNTTCRNNKKEISIDNGGGFIAGYQPIASRVTSVNTNCPLVLRAPRGQKINITLYEFFNGEDSTLMAHQSQYKCIVLATVKEYMATGYRGPPFQENVICARGSHSQELVYSSKSDEVTIEMNRLSVRGEVGPRFLLQYQAIGCRNPVIPDDMTLQRRVDQLDVRCNNTGQVWHLVCRGNSWVGEFGNCTADPGGMYYDGENGSKRGMSFPNAGIVMAIVVGIVLGIMIGFCLLLVVYNIRKKRRKAASNRVTLTARHAGGQTVNKHPEGVYGPNDPMLPPGHHIHPDLTMDKGCHMICDVTGTVVRGRDRDHVYEKPQSGMEIQCLLSQTKPMESPVMTTMNSMLDQGDYGCNLHSKKTWPQRGEHFEMIPPPPTCVIST